MPSDVWLGLAVGIGIGLANAAVSIVLYRIARKRPARSFYRIAFGGMTARMGAVLLAVVLVVALVPVHIPAFIGALLVVFVIGLAAEITVMARRPADPPSQS